MLLDRLARVEAHIAEGERILQRQRNLIDGSNATAITPWPPIRLLAQFEEIRALHVPTATS